MSVDVEIVAWRRRRIHDERSRTAWHEAAHALVAYALAGPDAIYAAVTIDPGMAWSGLAMVGAVRSAIGEWSADDVDVTDSPIAWVEPARRFFEVELAVLLAGEIGEELREPQLDEGLDEAEPPPRLPARTQPSWQRLPAAEREKLERAAVDEEIKSDREQAREVVYTLVGNDRERAAALWRYVAQETEVLLRRRRRQLEALVEALCADGALSADEVIAVLEANEHIPGGTTP